MVFTPGTIKPAVGSKHTTKRVGRGHGSQKGTSAGRGTKGQRARSGGKAGNSATGLKKVIQKIPKIRGFKSHAVAPVTISLAALERVVKSGDVVNPAYLKANNVVYHPEQGVKIVGVGPMTKKITIVDCLVSKGAIAAVEKAGGTITF